MEMSTHIPSSHMRLAVQEFLLPQIEIIEPHIVICLGLPTFNAVRESCGHVGLRPLDNAVRAAFDFHGSRIVAVAHPGYWGTRSRPPDLVAEDWASIRRSLNTLRKGAEDMEDFI